MKNKIHTLRTPFKKASLFLAVTGSLVSLNALAETGNPRVNQVGYLPNGPKIASYKTTQDAPQAWELKQNGKTISNGKTSAGLLDATSGDKIQQIDLSKVTATGTGFTLSVGGDTSYPFSISSTAFSGPLYDALRFYYHMRSGIEIKTQYTGGGGGTYAPDAKWARPAGHAGVAPNKGDVAVPCWTGTCNYSLNVSKGWYDAGDHGKYVVNGGISTWLLLNTFERASLISTKSADVFADTKLNIPESGNKIPDLLDEARWEVEFLISMQVPTGQPKAGMAHHKIQDTSWTGLPLAPEKDDRARALVPPTTAATLNLAAVAAQAARLWKTWDADFAATCLKAAQTAWDAAQANPADFHPAKLYDNGGGAYGDQSVKDEFYWAAAELYITTKDPKYLATLNNYKITQNNFSWNNTELLGLMALALVPVEHTKELRTNAQQKIIEIGKAHLATQETSAYSAPLGVTDFYWGSNSDVANKLALMGLAYDFSKNDDFAKGVGKGLDYFFGRNYFSRSYVTGEGTNAIRQPHHRFWAAALDAKFPWAPPGILSGGPNSGLQDDEAKRDLADCVKKPATCYLDSIGSFSTNELAINWNAPLVWDLAFYNSYADSVTKK